MSFVETAENVAAFRAELEAAGKKLVFTNGCFDILHVGHSRYLKQARALGDALVVALNSDASVRALKGPSRPVNSEEDRAELLCALESVDRVVVFSEERATRLIETIRPHLYSKGGDYTEESLDGEERAALRAVGSEIRILPLVEGRSTTNVVSKLRSGESKDRPLRLGVLGSGRGSNMASIAEKIAEGALNAEISLVLSDNEDAGILDLAAEYNAPAAFVNPGPYKTKLAASAQKEICGRLKAAEVDLVVLAGFMRLVKAPLLTAFPRRIINIHPSLLPKYKGLAAWKQALEAGEAEAGCTVHFVDAGMDTGEIISQARVPVLPGDSPADLHQRIQVEEHRLYPEVIGRLRDEILG